MFEVQRKLNPDSVKLSDQTCYRALGLELGRTVTADFASGDQMTRPVPHHPQAVGEEPIGTIRSWERSLARPDVAKFDHDVSHSIQGAIDEVQVVILGNVDRCSAVSRHSSPSQLPKVVISLPTAL